MACDPACLGENAEKKLKEIHQNSDRYDRQMDVDFEANGRQF